MAATCSHEDDPAKAKVSDPRNCKTLKRLLTRVNNAPTLQGMCGHRLKNVGLEFNCEIVSMSDLFLSLAHTDILLYIQ